MTLPIKNGRPKGSRTLRPTEDTLRAIAARVYAESIRYYVLRPDWQHVLTAQGAPIRHLGQYVNEESAISAARYVSRWVKYTLVWDQVTRLVINVCSVAVHAPLPEQQGVIEFYHMSSAGEVLEHIFYPPEEFIQLEVAGDLP